MPAKPKARFVKIGEDGKQLRLNAPAWVAVLDRETSLIWTRDDLPCGSVNWKAAKKACTDLTLAGAADWRLPTRKELLTLVDDTRHSPAIDTTFFPACKSDWYWTSTPAAYSPGDYAWFVDFLNGNSDWDSQRSGYHVRAVRSSQ